MAKKLFAENQPAVDLDRDILSADEITAIEQEAADEAAAEEKEQARVALKAKLKNDAKRAKGLIEPEEQITVDLAPYCDRILIDNVAYLQGVTYTVPASRAMVMREICQRTWGHQAEIDGKSENFYRRTRGARVVPAGNGAAVINTSQLLRA